MYLSLNDSSGVSTKQNLTDIPVKLKSTAPRILVYKLDIPTNYVTCISNIGRINRSDRYKGAL